MENEPDEIVSGLLTEIRNYLIENYEPVTDPIKADFHFSTLEMYHKLQRVLPDKEKFTPADVAAWLHVAGFKFADYGSLDFEWLLKSKQ